ncbi:MAG: D-2-hydroxyacid dehydrogenase [Terrimicrobiaceae bacterium]
MTHTAPDDMVTRLRIFSDAPLNGSALEILKKGAASHELVFPRKASESVLVRTEPDPALADADIAFGQPDVASILRSERLRWVHLTSAGYTRYDTPEFRSFARTRGLLVTNSSTVYVQACAEHVFSFMLAEARLLPQGLRTRCAGGAPEWIALREGSTLLQNQRAVILGFGTIASRLLELLAPFAMKVTAMRRNPRGDEKIPTVTPENLRQAFSTADHVISILPDNAESLHFISSERFGWMKPGAIFYNIGRGTTVDQQALRDSLLSGQLRAAWLDVTDPEPLPDDHPLWATPNCYITPHTAGGHRNESETLVRHFLENFNRFLGDLPLRDRIM